MRPGRAVSSIEVDGAGIGVDYVGISKHCSAGTHERNPLDSALPLTWLGEDFVSLTHPLMVRLLVRAACH